MFTVCTCIYFLFSLADDVAASKGARDSGPRKLGALELPLFPAIYHSCVARKLMRMRKLVGSSTARSGGPRRQRGPTRRSQPYKKTGPTRTYRSESPVAAAASGSDRRNLKVCDF